MYGTLGFVDNDRRSLHRDAAYMGQTSHPSRRELNGARRPTEEKREIKSSDEKPAQLPVQMPSPIQSLAQQAIAKPTGAITGNLGEALVQRRCEYLEAQDKRRLQDILELKSEVLKLQEEMLTTAKTLSQESFSVTGLVANTAPTRADVNGKIGEQIESTLASKDRILLFYPMIEYEGGVWMRKKKVCSKRASISFDWVCVYKHEGEEVFVNDFKPM